MGLVSSAIYRYYATRDELLTALIVDAYNDVGEVAERAFARCAPDDPRRQLHAVANAVRSWAKRNPHQYALLYGSPVPDYEAPELTIEPATRVTAVLASIVTGAWGSVAGDDRPGGETTVPASVLERHAFDVVMPGVPDIVRVRALMVWTQIYGFISFELFGHYVGSVRSASRFFDLVMDQCADLVMPPVSDIAVRRAHP